MEISQKQKGKEGRNLPAPLLKELVSILLAYGREEDKALAVALCRVYSLDVKTLAAGVLARTGLINPKPHAQNR